MKNACMLVAITSMVGTASAAEFIFSDSFDNLADDLFLQNWTVTETGDFGMTYGFWMDSIAVSNGIEGGGNDQTIIFSHPAPTEGFHDLVRVDLWYYASDDDDFESTDFVRLLAYPNGPNGNAIIEASTEGMWSPGNNPSTGSTLLRADLGSYAEDNPDLWVGIEVNTSLPRETILLDHISTIVIPEPTTMLILGIGGLMSFRRSRTRRFGAK